MDWGSPQILEQYGSMESLFEWSSPGEDSSSEEELCDLIKSSSAGATAAVLEEPLCSATTPIHPIDILSVPQAFNLEGHHYTIDGSTKPQTPVFCQGGEGPRN